MPLCPKIRQTDTLQVVKRTQQKPRTTRVYSTGATETASETLLMRLKTKTQTDKQRAKDKRKTKDIKTKRIPFQQQYTKHNTTHTLYKKKPNSQRTNVYSRHIILPPTATMQKWIASISSGSPWRQTKPQVIEGGIYEAPRQVFQLSLVSNKTIHQSIIIPFDTCQFAQTDDSAHEIAVPLKGLQRRMVEGNFGFVISFWTRQSPMPTVVLTVIPKQTDEHPSGIMVLWSMAPEPGVGPRRNATPSDHPTVTQVTQLIAIDGFALLEEIDSVFTAYFVRDRNLPIENAEDNTIMLAQHAQTMFPLVGPQVSYVYLPIVITSLPGVALDMPMMQAPFSAVWFGGNLTVNPFAPRMPVEREEFPLRARPHH